jgi:hypothetical protein
MKVMIRTSLFLIFFTFLLSGCVNKHGISVKYYSDCKEYYDFQGYYHKECGKDDVITYEGMGKALKRKVPESTENVY